ncbi:MAG TPA: peptide ligase PGM1-related protein [Alphaproteobacteria bacterium]|nr:peptide ligase PGM1-related protein [Alphaproteobacteria bacterium]
MSDPHTLPLPQLGLDPEEAARRFELLQQKLVPLWKSIRTLSQDEQTIVVVPSMTAEFDIKGAEMQAYEERFLFLLLLLRQPRARMIYVTSQSILPSIIDYYLGLLPGVIVSHARARLFLVSPQDRSPRPLTVKLLERPHLIDRIISLIPDRNRAHLVPYNTTYLERDLALRLGIPMYGADPKFFPFGTKTGSRRLFAEAGVPHPLGYGDIQSAPAAVAAIQEMRGQKPSIQQVLVKLNEALSGEGNAVVDLQNLPLAGAGEERREIEMRLRAMQCELAGMTYDVFCRKLERHGGVVEERIVGEEFRSPSVQLRVTPLGEAELLSTHDQLLGGASNQSYLGCRFPADPDYAALISREAEKIGLRLAKEGVIGRFAVDFVVVRNPKASWRVYAIEVNLRKGGTTHPFLTLQFLTDGSYDTERAVFVAPNGREKHFVATDHLESGSYRAFSPDDLFDMAVRRGLHFDQTRQTGVVFHMLASLAENGRIGLVAIEDSAAEADALYRRTQSILDEEVLAALTPRALPSL